MYNCKIGLYSSIIVQLIYIYIYTHRTEPDVCPEHVYFSHMML